MTLAKRGTFLAMALLLFAGLGGLPQLWAFPEQEDLEQARDEQKKIQADTDMVVKRVNTMLRVLKFYGADKGQENQMLEEVAATLAGLSREQMAEVIDRLGKAARTQDPGKSNEEVLKAHERHLEIIESLSGILAKYDSVRNLDHAADRLEEQAKKQLELYLLTNTIIRTEEERHGLRQITPAQRALLNQRLKNHLFDMQSQGSSQAELDREVNRIMDHIQGLFSKLPENQQERITAMQKRAKQLRLQEHLTLMVQKLKTQGGTPQTQVDRLRDTNELQKETYANLLELSGLLRSPSDTAAALASLRDEVAKELARQNDLKNDTQDQQNKVSPDDQHEQLMKAYQENVKRLQDAGIKVNIKPPPSIVNPRVLPGNPKDPQQAKAMQKVQELGKQQARLGLDTSKTRGLLDKHAQSAAAEMAKAERAMDNAKEMLDRADTAKAADAQQQASDALKNTLKDLDEKIAQLKKDENNPLANLERANEKLAEIIKDQQDIHAKTKESAEKPSFKNANLADKQADLAERTNALQNQPLPSQPKTQEALDKATQAMTKAFQNLKEQEPGQAVPKQQESIKALKDVKNDLEKKIAEMKDRQDAIEKLARESQKLDRLAKEQAKVAEDAKQQANPQDLGKKQAELTPQAQESAKNLAQSAPKAAQKANEAAQQMDAAKKQLDSKKLDPAAAKAEDAKAKLDEAKEEVNKKLAELRADQIKEQQAMQPGKTDPMATRNQLEQALKQAKEAAQQAQQAQQQQQQFQKAQKPENQAKNNQELAQIQKEIAKKAAELNLPEAKDKAKEAEQALKDGDLPRAVEKQQAALDEIKKAEDAPLKPGEAKEAPMPMEQDAAEPAEPKAGNPKPNEASENKPNQAQPPAQAKNSPPPQAQPKKGQPKPGEAKPNRPSPQSKPGETKDTKGQPKNDTAKPSEAKQNAPKQGDPKAGECKACQGKAGEKKDGEPKEAKQGQPKQGGGEPKNAQAKEGQPKQGQQPQAKSQAQSQGQPKPSAKSEGQKPSQPAAKQGECKACQGKSGSCSKCAGNKSGSGQGDPKAGQPGEAQAKQPGQPGQKPGEQQAQAPSPEQAKSPQELGQAQKELLEQTKPLAKAQETTQAAKNALDQAQAQAPQPLQEQLDRANKELSKANDELAKGNPEKAAEAQEQAAQQIEQALQALDKAMENMDQEAQQQAQAGKPGDKPGSKPGSKPGQGSKAGQKPGDPKSQAKKSEEKNDSKGNGNRIADGKVSNAESKLGNVIGDGSFIHLPPREREMIRQALNDRLPPEFAAEIQQYFINLARTRNSPSGPPAGPR